MMMLICVKQRLSKVWSSIHEQDKQHWGRVEKALLVKKSVYSVFRVLDSNFMMSTSA